MITYKDMKPINTVFEVRNVGERLHHIPTERFDTLEEAQKHCDKLIEEKSLLYGSDFRIRIIQIVEEPVLTYDPNTRTMVQL